MKYGLNIFVSFFILLISACNQSNYVVISEPEEQEVRFALQPAFPTKHSDPLAKGVNSGVGVRSVVITILDSNGSAVYTDRELSLVGSAFSEPLLVTPGTYTLSEYRAIDALGNTLYATPKSGSILAPLVDNPLDIDFTVFKDSVTLVRPQILEVDVNTPADFGYTAFNGSTPAFLVKVYTQTLQIEENTFTPVTTSMNVVVRDSSDSLYTLDYTIAGGIDVIRLPEAQDSTYTFTIVSENLDTPVHTLPYDSLTAGPGIDTTYLVNFILSSTVYVTWEHTGTLTLNTTSSGADISTDLYDFPTLVRITDPAVFEQSQTNGEDLRFSKADRSVIPYEIEDWDSAGSSATVWVYLDTIYGNNSSQFINMHWGNPSAASESNGQNVFDAQRYSAVWHMSEDPSEGFSSIRDHTSNEQHISPAGNMTSADRIDGVVGKALDLDGVDDYLDVGGLSSSFQQGYFMCTWVNYDIITVWARMWDCANGPSTQNMLLLNVGASARVGFYARHPNQISTTGDVLVLNSWKHVCGVVNPSGVANIYIDGQSEASGTIQLPIEDIRHNCYIGRSNWNGDGYLNAQLDEYTIGKVEPSADRIKLYYESQRAGASWITLTR
jgi:hypothetical protein